MKKFILILFLCQFPVVFGQNWLNEGAEWHYRATSEALNTYHHLKLVGDTTVQGIGWQRVKHQQYTHLPTSSTTDTLLNDGFIFHYFRMNGDTLFTLENGVEDVVIIFQDQAVWKSPSDLTNPTCIRVPVYKAVAQTLVLPDATTLPVFSVSDTLITEFNILGKYARRFGCFSGFFTPQVDCSIASILYVIPTYNLICYQDNNGYSVNTTTGNCTDYLSLSTENISLNPVHVYPNPVTDFVTIFAQQPIDLVECYDLNGKKMKIYFHFETNQLDVQMLNKGVYFLKITSGTDQRVVKLIVE